MNVKPISNKEEYKSLCAELVTNLEIVLSDGDRYIEAIRQITCLRNDLGKEDYDEDFSIFYHIADLTEHMPAQKTRTHWEQDALRKLDEELIKIQEEYRNKIEISCNNLVKRFK